MIRSPSARFVGPLLAPRRARDRARPALARPLAGALALAAGLAAGCQPVAGPGAGGEVPENPAPPVSALADPAHPGLEDCRGGLSPAEVSEALQIARGFEDSMHEMVVCGGLAGSFSGALLQMLVHAAAGDTTHPAGFVYRGEGRWDAGGQMHLVLHLPVDTSWGRRGDPIPFDVFDPGEYFGGLAIEASASVDLTGRTTTSYAIRFTETRRGAELLGLAAGAGGGGSITLSTDQLLRTLGAIEVRGRIVVSDRRSDGTRADYTLASRGGTIAELGRAGGQMPMDLVSVAASRDGTAQTLAVRDWAMVYTAGSTGTLDGSVAVAITGGAFDYVATYTYPHRRTPDVTLDCL